MARYKVDFNKFFRVFPLAKTPEIIDAFYVPIQTVVGKPQYVVPDVGRIYATDSYLVDGCEAVDIDTFKKMNSPVKEVVVVEAWLDYGHDGYVKYNMCGYFFAVRGDCFCVNPLRWRVLNNSLYADFERQIADDEKKRHMQNLGQTLAEKA